MSNLLAVPLTCWAMACSVPAAAQASPLAVAGAFLDAMKAGDVNRIRSQLTSDAILIAGAIGVPLAGIEEVLARPERRKCDTTSLSLKTEATHVNLFGNQTPPSIKAGGGRTLEGVLLCASDAGGFRETPFTLIVVRARVAFVGFDRSKVATPSL